MNRRQRFSAACRPLLIGVSVGLLFLIVGSVHAAHCPPSDANRADCAKAAETAQNPLVAFFGALIGAFFGLFASPVYAEEPPATKPRFATDKGRAVETTDDGDPQHPHTEQADRFEDNVIENWGLKGKVKKVGASTNRFNCHGFTFCNKEAWVVDWKAVDDILSDNGYEDLSKVKKAKGDVAVYRVDVEEKDENGNVTKKVRAVSHTGIIVEVDANGNPTLIESKWGKLGVYQHAPNDLKPDWGKDPTYYRTGRPGGNTLNQGR